MSTEIYSVFDVANWFMKKGANIHKKIQKLCYYAQAWSYVFNNAPMIDSGFEAWVHGPVNRPLWDELKKYGYFDIDLDVLSQKAKEITDVNVLNVLEQVWATYGEYSGFELERLSHTELPWLKAREGYGDTEPSTIKIDPMLMKSYYASLLAGDGVGE